MKYRLNLTLFFSLIVITPLTQAEEFVSIKIVINKLELKNIPNTIKKISLKCQGFQGKQTTLLFLAEKTFTPPYSTQKVTLKPKLKSTIDTTKNTHYECTLYGIKNGKTYPLNFSKKDEPKNKNQISIKHCTVSEGNKCGVSGAINNAPIQKEKNTPVK